MALSRPFLLALIGVALLFSTFVATRGAGQKDAGATSKPPAKAQHPAKPAQHAPKPKHAAAKAKTVAGAPAHAKPATKPAAGPGPLKVKPAGTDPGAVAGLPLPVAKAFAARRVVVLFFAGSGADDAATADSVRALEHSGSRHVAVFTGKLSKLSDYRRVVEGLDVTQAPSIVIVGRDRKARLLEGFVDAGSLRQQVADVAK